MKIKEYLLNNSHELKIGLICLMVFTIPFKLNISNIALILATIFNILFFDIKNVYKLKSFANLFPIVFFIITIISSLLSKNSSEGLMRTDLELILLMIVLVLVNCNLTSNNIDKVLRYFFLGSVLSSLILIAIAILKLIGGADIDDIIFHKYPSLFDIHPVYFSMFMSFALLIRLVHLKIVTRNISFSYFISIAILILSIILCASKAVIAIDILIITTYIIFKEKYLWLKIAKSSTFILLSIALLQTPFLNQRFKEGLQFDRSILTFKPTNDFSQKKIYNYDEKLRIGDLELRYLLASIGVNHLIKDEKVFFGYGQGDAQYYFDYYLFSYNLGPNWYEGFNIHNQYLHLLITYGILVLAIFMSYLIYSYYIAINDKNLLLFYFLIINSFIFLFEVTLVRNKGIIFFYFFNTLLLNHHYFENRNYRHPRNTQ